MLISIQAAMFLRLTWSVHGHLSDPLLSTETKQRTVPQHRTQHRRVLNLLVDQCSLLNLRYEGVHPS